VDQGQIDLEGLREVLATDDRVAWVRAVARPEETGKQMLLFAQATIGSQPEEWPTSNWVYEQCIFCSGGMPAPEFGELLRAGTETSLSIGGVDAHFELANSSFSWQRKPSRAQYDELPLPWPKVIYQPSFAQRNVYAPPAYLVGEDDTPTFPLFGAAFGAFFFGDYRLTGTRNPQLGELSICVVDQRSWIERVDQNGTRIAITLGGDGLAGTVLEFNSAEFHKTFRPDSPGQQIVDLPSESTPPDAWVWLKRGADWLDYRNLQRWGGYVSPDVTIGVEEVTIELSGSNVLRSTPVAPSGPALWLRERASEYAKRAMTEYVSSNLHDFFLFAGLGIELALKSRLAEQNPAFLAPDGRFASAIALSNASEDIARLPSGTRTVGGRVALDRYVQLHSSANWLSGGIAELLALRNGEAHLGVIDGTMQRRAFNSFLQGFNTILDPDLEEFWAPHYEYVRATLDENAQQVQQAVTLKLSQARERFRQIESLTSQQRDAILALVVSHSSVDFLDDSPVVCPACGSQAVARGSNVMDYDEPDFDRDGPVGGRLWVQFSPESLRCDVCGLVLDNPEELFHAGVPNAWENEDEDVMSVFLEREAEVSQYADYDPVPADDDSEEE
jgi:hypothetical protein